jgi:hypothetical protein
MSVTSFASSHSLADFWYTFNSPTHYCASDADCTPDMTCIEHKCLPCECARTHKHTHTTGRTCVQTCRWASRTVYATSNARVQCSRHTVHSTAAAMPPCVSATPTTIGLAMTSAVCVRGDRRQDAHACSSRMSRRHPIIGRYASVHRRPAPSQSTTRFTHTTGQRATIAKYARAVHTPPHSHCRAHQRNRAHIRWRVELAHSSFNNPCVYRAQSESDLSFLLFVTSQHAKKSIVRLHSLHVVLCWCLELECVLYLLCVLITHQILLPEIGVVDVE